MTKKRRVPEVLWRLFQNRARTLAETILSLLPPPPSSSSAAATSQCRCKGNRKCIRCDGGDDPMSFLLRENDPSDYRKLLHQCFVVVSDNAPPPPPFDPHCRWSQLEIVRRTVEMILCQKTSTLDIICSGYDKHKSSSSIVEALTSAAWSLLLKRVGDSLMVYLLKYSSIFMPLPRKKHHQVAGIAISDLCWKLPKHTSESKSRQPSGFVERFGEVYAIPENVDSLSTSVSCIGCNDSGYSTPCRRLSRNKSSSTNSCGDATKTNCRENTHENSKLPAAQSRKRLRPYAWQRKSKRKRLSSQNSHDAEVSLCKEKMKFPCTCCSVLQKLEKVPRGVQINRQSILYKLEPGSSTFPGKRVNYPIESCKNSFVEQHAFPSEPQDLYCQKKQVVSFIWATCRSIVPRELLGSPSNWRIIRKNISRFIRLRRYEKFSLRQCVHKLKTSNFSFLSDKHSLCNMSYDVQSPLIRHAANIDKRSHELSDGAYIMKQKLLERWIYWLFTSIVVPLIQANFYVTESEHGRQEVFFYRKSIWKKLMKGSVSCLNNQCYCLLDEAAVRKILSTRAFGFSRVRLRPKATGVRPLANLKASSRLPPRESSWKADDHCLLRHPRSHPRADIYKDFKAVNVVLRDLHAALKDVQLKRPEKLGSSVFNYNDVYRKLRHFLRGVKNGLSSLPSVFVVVADVAKAYDSIDQDKLLHVMKDVITDDHLLQRSHQVVGTKTYMQVCQNINLSRQSPSYGHALSFHSVLVNQNLSRRVRKEELLFNLQEHVKNNILRIDKMFYRQSVGIPQGSILSSLLCSFYYGHMENNNLVPFLDKTSKPGLVKFPEKYDHDDASIALNCHELAPRDLLLRFMDDFLFISTSKNQACSFFVRLKRGFRQYNCNMNGEKFGLNFEVDTISRPQSKRLFISENGDKFLRWSGLLINCKTLEVQADYIRYLDAHLSSTLTVRWQDNPGRHFRGKLCDYMRPKCHAIFYDSNINSAAVVRLNIHQAFLLCAMKFHCYICDLSDICRLDSESCVNSIQNSLRYMFKLMKKRMYSLDVDPSLRPILKVKKREVEWLGLTAYIQVLKRKQSRYKELLAFLELKLKSLNLERASPALEYAVDKSNSSILWKIKY